MASAQNLLGLCFFGCAPDAAFLGFAWWLQFRSGWGTISLFLGVPKATFRHFSGCGFAMASAQNLLGFCFFACASETPFFWVWPGGLQASKFYVALCLAWSNLSQPFFFVFSRFQKQRFGSFLAAVSYGLGTTLLSFFLVGSKSDVSAFFWLRFRNGFGTKPAGVLLFRMRVRNTFFLSLAWWLAGFQVLRCAVPCLRQPFATFFLCF